MSKRAGDTKEAREAEAARRQKLEGNTQFADLGEPIKKLLMLVSKDVSTDDFKLLTKITVRQLAKVFDMLSLEEDPDKIMAWLTREARKAQGIEDPAAKKKHPKGVATGANRDAIAFYKELERKNLELVEAMKREQEEREEQRKTNIAERRRRREEAVQRAAEAKQRALEKGEVVSSKESLRKTDIRDIVGAFDRAAAKSNADNSASVTDTEWWKQDTYRRDFEKNGPKGAAWNRVIEGGSQKATEAELAAREEWFRSQCWWKSDKYKRDWLASRDAEWWKEETYIRDWQDHGEKGAMWTAADETSGFNRKGDRRPAATVELARRVEWYKNNGPKGIVKLWCALSEGVADRCTLEEKRERDDYYKNGDWWKSDRNKLKLSDAPDASIVTFAGSAGEDREWWKDESYRRDFSSGGNAWKAASEKSAVTGDKVECTPAEAAKREEWFAENWWKAQKYADDFRKNGDKGKLWRARSEEDSASPSGKQCKESEAAIRAEWYKSAEDREWWKDERFLRDFQEHGNKGTMWTAAWKEAGDNATGDKNPAKPDVLKAREEWYNNNWWKAEKYVKDFQVHGKQGTAWRAGSAAAHEDLDWWKQGEYVRKFAAAKKNTVENFWQDPKYIEDYFANGAKGKGWIAAHAAAASVGKGDEVRANPEEVAAREKWYEDNWWKSPECVRDFATHGSDGKAWTAATRGSKDRASPEELGRRREFFQPQTATTASYDAMFEADATAPVTGTFAAPQTVADREEKMRKDWWKSAKVAEDYRRNGKNSQLFKAATAEVAAMGLGDQPMYQASPEELKEREAYFDSEFWKSPAALSAYLKNGDASPFVKAADLAAVANGKASDPKYQASPEEIAERKAVLDADWWKAPEVRDEYKKLGAASPLFKAASREDAAKGLGNDPAHQASAEELERRKAYFDDDWWRKSPEVRAEYMKMGTASPLFKAATMEDAAKGLGNDPAHQASAEELERRKAFFEKDWLKSPEVLDDFVKRGKASPFLKASSYDAAIRGLANDPAHQCAPEEQKEREQFFEDNWWKAPSVMSDYLKKGEDSPLFKAASQDAAAKGLGSDPKYQATPEEIAERKAFFDAEWWKAPEVREEYKKMGLASPLFKAATREDASQGLGNDPAHQASADELERRRAFFDDNVEKPQWWHDDEHMREAAAARDPTFWKNPEYVEDFLKNGANGRKWRAGNAAAGSTGKADEVPASEDELARRREFFEKNFWMAPEYKEDWERHGDKGTLWQQSQPNGKGTVVDDADRKARVAFYKPKAAWQLRTQPTSEEAKLAQCTPAESLDRRQWYEDNWWKSPEVKEDFEKYGRNSKLLKAATQEAADMGLADNPMYQASPEEVEARAQYFEKAGDNEWWKDPAVVDDYVKHGKEGAKWQARTLRESEMSMGLEAPATKDELEKRAQWFEKNFWKTPAALDDYVKNGNKGAMWKRGARPGVGETPEEAAKNAVANPASQAEIDARRQWFESHAPVNTEEANRRREWMERQLTDEEKVARRTWVKKSTKESKRIANDELVDALAALNDGQKPSEEQLKEIEDAVRRRRAELGFKPANQEEIDTITQEEFVVAVADTNFYVPQTDEEKLRAEEEALAAMQMEELNRQTEEAAYLAMEAEEERIKAGLTEEEAAALAAATQDNDEEAAFLDELEQDGLEAKPNEDDIEVTEDQDAAWNDFIENQKNSADEELTPEEEARLAAEEEARLQAEAAAAEAADEAWASEEFEGEEDAPVDAEPEIDDAEKEELEELVEEDPEEQWDNEEEDWGEDAAPEEEEIDELLVEEKGQPLQWKLPLPEVTNPQFLKSYFTVIKYTPSHSLLGGKQKRVWVVDHFTRCFYNLEKSGKIKKEHAANKLLQLERNVSDPLRLRLMFFDAAHSYELQFYSPQERERFYESASAIRPSIRVYAPDLTNQDASVEACTTTIDGVGANTVSVTVNNAAGKPVARELSGECKINASKLLTEPLTLWCGTFNLSGHHPPRNSTELNDWMPKDKYDIYAVAVQEASYRKEESEWFEYVQHHLGKEYLTLASMSVWDTLLIVLSRKKHLLKITNVEGSTKATVHKSVCGTKGGIGISLRFLETSMAFVTCHLAARLERNAMRNTNLEEIVDGLQLAIRETDFCNQFNHVFFFGDFNYRLELDNAAAAEMIEAKQYSALLDYDQLTIQRRDEGILHGFQEPPITFPPTYRMQVGSEQYMAEKGNAPSYCARVLTRSMANTWVKCTGYKSFRNVQVSEHLPVHATFIVRCVRPTMSCFMKQQSPIPQFIFEELSFSESTGPIIKKPQLMITSPFTGVVKNIDAASASTASPAWNTIPKMESVTQAQEYLETCHFILIIKDASEKREDKAHRGTAHLPLFSRVIGLQDMQQEFDADIMSHGKLVGKLVGKFRWEAAPLQM